MNIFNKIKEKGVMISKKTMDTWEDFKEEKKKE